MPVQPWMKMLSVDDHLIEHPRVWSDRLSSRYLEAGPRIVDLKRPGGSQPAEACRLPCISAPQVSRPSPRPTPRWR